jgi:hypothetical protein
VEYFKKWWYQALGWKEIKRTKRKNKETKIYLVRPFRPKGNISPTMLWCAGLTGAAACAAYLKLRGVEGAKQDVSSIGAKIKSWLQTAPKK